MIGLRRFIFYLLFILPAPTIIIAQDVQFYAETETKEVAADGYFEVYFKIDNGNGQDLLPPSFSDFNLLGGPSFSSQTSIINGEATRSSSYTFVLEPKGIGRFAIGAATVMVNGKKYTSKPIFIDVVKAKSSNDINDQIKNGGDVFVRMEVSNDLAYPGQQIILDYMVYSRINVSSYSFNSESKYTGIYVKPFKNYDAGEKIKTVGGRQYKVRNLRRLALFPQQSGTLTIDPAVITLGIPMENDDAFGSLFSSSKPKQVRTNAVNIEVRSLPTPSPKGFLGAVGDYQYTVTSDKNTLSTDDAAMLTFKISGNGDMKKIQTPQMNSDTIADYYPAEVLEDSEQERSGEWLGTKTFVIDLTPKKAGNLNIEVPPFVYFDPKIKDYRTIDIDPLQFAVSEGSGQPVSDSEPIVSRNKQTFFQKNKVLILGGGGALILLGLFAFMMRPKRNTENIEIPAKTQVPEQAKTVVEPKPAIVTDPDILISEAQYLRLEGNWRSYLLSLNTILGKYLSERLDIPFSRFSPGSVRSALESISLPDDQVTMTVSTMKQLEGAVYGGYYNESMADSMTEKVKDIMSNINRHV